MSGDRAPPIWRAASRATPRPCAVITSPTDTARGRYWVIGDVMNTPGRSLYVRLTGPDSGPGAAGKWTDAATGEHGDLLDLIRPQPQPDMVLARPWTKRAAFSPCHRPPIAIADESRPCATSRERLFRSGAPPVSCRPPRSRHAGRGLSARPRHHRTARLARLALSPVGLLPRRRGRCRVRNLAGAACRRHRSRRQRSPASSAPGSIAPRSDQGAACRSAPRPRPSARQRRALRQGRPTSSRPAKASRPCWRSNRCCPHCPMIAGLSANHLAALDLPPALRRLYVARDNDAAGLKAAKRLRERGIAPVSKSASSCRSMATSTSTSAVSAPTACGRISRISSSPPTARAFCPMIAAPIRGGEIQRQFGSPAPSRKEGLFVCGDGMPQPEKSRACGLPERRSAGGEGGLQWRRPTIFRRRPQPHRAGAMGTPLAGAALQREAK